MVASSLSPLNSFTNALSIFSSQAGKRLRYSRLEYPVPKSSMDAFTPAFVNSVSTRTLSSGLLIAVVSVTSRISISGGTWWHSRQSRTVLTSDGCSNCNVDRFTAIDQSWCPWRCHSLSWRQASLITQLPIGMISPVFSASGRKRSGVSSPCLGCCQRNSASNPRRGPAGAWNFGWYNRRSSLRSMAIHRSFINWRWVCARVFMEGWKKW